MTEAERNEEGRYQVRKFLYNRRALNLPASQIADGLTRQGFPCTTADVEEWCGFRKDQGQLAFTYPDGGSTKYWRITAAGQLAQERPE